MKQLMSIEEYSKEKKKKREHQIKIDRKDRKLEMIPQALLMLQLRVMLNHQIGINMKLGQWLRQLFKVKEYQPNGTHLGGHQEWKGWLQKEIDGTWLLTVQLSLMELQQLLPLDSVRVKPLVRPRHQADGLNQHLWECKWKPQLQELVDSE